RGDVAVFIGRLLPPLRALMPVLAGMSRLPVRRFLIADFFAALFWAGVHLGLGAAIGHWLFLYR
uniref:DedA family protein n=1 Tax=Oleiagrimonas sp. TaxID=2010330 RepID=UPI0026299A53